MLSEIYIKNYILVPELRLKFKPGLTVITGETGAGKSILVGSIGIILGESPAGLEAWDPLKPIYLEASFRPQKDDALQALLAEINSNSEDELVLAREISKSGKSSYYIDGRKVSASVMKSLKPLLLDFHHQRDQQKILQSAYQLDILDRYAGCMKEREEFRKAFKELKNLRVSLAEMLRRQEQQSKLIELYRYQYEELENANIKLGEDLALQKEHELLSHSQEIIELCYAMNSSLFESENSIFDQLGNYGAKLERYKELNPALDNAHRSLSEAVEALRTTSSELSTVLDTISFEPKRLSALEERLDLINSLLHKHKVKNVEDLQQLFKERERDIHTSQSFDKEISETRKKLEQDSLKLIHMADKLSALRQEAARKLSKALQTGIRKLALKDARFEIRIDKKSDPQILHSDVLESFTDTGQDAVEFLFSANPGSSLKSLSAVASGGEMSRILLGIKEVLVSKESARLLILDEIDSGIGGKTADSVALCIADIAKKHPVLCITHLAQIASVADSHILVEKIAKEKTSVNLRVLEPAQRIPELARMLSGEPSELALKHAEELINRY